MEQAVFRFDDNWPEKRYVRPPATSVQVMKREVRGTEWRPAAKRRATIELAGLTSVLAVALTYALHRFAGLSEMPLVLGTLVIASIVGWTQPALRAAPRRTGRLTPVVVPIGHRRVR